MPIGANANIFKNVRLVSLCGPVASAPPFTMTCETLETSPTRDLVHRAAPTPPHIMRASVELRSVSPSPPSYHVR